MKAIVLPALVLSLIACLPASAQANPADDFVTATVRFDIPRKDLIPGIAAVRARCDVAASGEPLTVLANGSARSTLGVSEGPCSIILVLAGVDVALPLLNTTPLGMRSFYLPGVSTVTLGVVDLSIDLVTSVDSESRVEDGSGEVIPRNLSWIAWGAQRIRVHGADGFGSVVETTINTTFTYRMSLALSVYALSVRLYHMDLVEIGSSTGTPSLMTELSMDLRPHPLALDPADGIRHDRATVSWSGAIDADVDHLELWLTDGTSNVSLRLAPTAPAAEVLVRPSTSYRAWIVAVDRSGQGTPSNGLQFESASAPTGGNPSAVGPLTAAPLTWTLIALVGLAGVMGYAFGAFRNRKRD